MEDGKEYTDIIGGHGRFQIAVLVFCFFGAVAHCVQDFTIIFFAPNVDHWCARPKEVLQSNISVEEWKNFSLPVVKSRSGVDEYSRCAVYNISIKNGSLHRQDNADIIQCTSWEYDLSFYKNTIVNEWDLVCDREWLVSMSKTVYMLSYFLSSLINGQLSDRFGRRKVLIFCLSWFLAFVFLTLLSTNIAMFMVFRFLSTFGITSVFVNSTVILAELVSAKYRVIYCLTYKYGWSLGYLLLPLIAWLVPNWFWLHFVVSFPCILLLSVLWIVPETPRWLLIKRKFPELEKLLLYGAKKNGKDLKQAKNQIEDYIAYHSQKIVKEEKATVLDLLRPAVRKNTFILYFSWFINSYIYYALSWNTNDLGGDPYWNFFLCGAVELPEVVLCIFLGKFFGNRRCLFFFQVMAGICLIAMALTPPDIVWLTIVVSMSGKFFSSGVFGLSFVYTPEIFPTVMRNAALGSASACARVGALLSPFIHQMADVTYAWVPIAIPGALCICSGLLVLLLPEMKDKALQDTLQERVELRTQEIPNYRSGIKL
ncbi:Organic cation transporter protein [Araneus ventricosus]|uniref:Organic cation transporter protein n=1 Tax=Araneus ventricosus TaxID=182803 RepID=A0A4Y2NRU0_ARAVE|nr:Organic cation transporter protein [Araneus ventricosus]